MTGLLNKITNVGYVVEKTNRRLVLIESKTLNELTATASAVGDSKEIGGLLLGYRRGNHLHITKSTFPGKKDVSQRYKFIRQDISHQLIAFSRWVRSGKKMGWIGEWHTHPETFPSPSLTDLSSWKSLVDHNNQPMAFIIIGTKDKWVGMMLPDTHEVIKLQLLEQSEAGLLFG